jgi:dienelactone hydrolase
MTVGRLQLVRETDVGAVRESRLVLRTSTHGVPAVLWRPGRRADPPVVLLGHGGGGHKRIDRHVRIGTWLATHAGIAALSIDGPFHGDRRVPGDGRLDYQARVAREGAAAVHDRMRSDWLDTLAAVAAAGWVDGGRVGYLGMSMGGRYGIPVCAALGPRLTCAVIGKFGLTQSPPLPDTLSAPEMIATAARAVRAPVLQHVQWDDEIFPRAGQLELFDLLASPDKQLRARPGTHGQDRPDDETAWIDFLRTHLEAEGLPPGASAPVG